MEVVSDASEWSNKSVPNWYQWIGAMAQGQDAGNFGSHTNVLVKKKKKDDLGQKGNRETS